MVGIVRRIEPCSGRLGGIHDDEQISGERCRCPVGEQRSVEPGVVRRGSLVIRAEYSVVIEKSVYGRGDPRAAL